jgi:hypothetical protein
MAEKMTGTKEESARSYLWVFLALALLLIVLRFIRLEIDSPYFFAGYTQSHLTDPYQFTYHARNAVKFGEWNLFDFYRWDIFKYSLVSGVAFLLFSIFGVSMLTANLSGLLLNVSGLTFFILGLRGHRTYRETGIAAILLLLSSMLFFYGRLPFLENGLIFLSGLIFFLFMKFHERWWGQLLTGFLIGLAAMTGKLFGFVMLAPVIACLFYANRSQGSRAALICIAGSIAAVAACVIIFFGGDISTVTDYYREQTLGMYGIPQGLTSPIGFLLRLISFGGDSGFFALSAFLIMLTSMSIVLFFLRLKNVRTFDRQVLPIFFAVVWVLVGFLALMPFNYRPLRYTLFLFPPMAAVCAFAVNLLYEKKLILRFQNKLISLPVTFLICLYVIMQVFMLLAPSGQIFLPGPRVIVLSAGVAAAVTLLIYIRFNRRKRAVGRVILAVVVLPLVVGLVIRQGWLLYEGLVRPGEYLKSINREIGQLIDRDAVITGPYAPAFSIDNNLKSFIYLFGLANLEEDLFKEYPITHVTTDRSNWNRAIEDYPSLSSSLILRWMRLRDGVVELYRLPDAAVPMTDYELAAASIAQRQYESAVIYSEKFVREYPDNLSGRFGLLIARYTTGDVEELSQAIQVLASKHPDNYRVHMFCRDFYGLLKKKTGNQNYIKMAEYHFERAREINPSLGK